MSTNVPGGPQPEYLGPGGPVPADLDEPDTERPSRRRTGLVVGSVVAVVAALGVGGYGLAQLMSGGESAASAVPADALAYVDLDLDPSAAQKIEAFKIMRKFPSLRKQIGSRDDLREAIVEGLVDSADCKGLSYADDVEPWVGNRLAVAAVPDVEDIALPLVALQVTDQAKAKQGITALQRCGDASGSVGISFTGDYAVITEKQQDADRLAKQAETASLVDDSDFSAWVHRAGDPGIVTMYVSKAAPDALVESFKRSMTGELPPMPSSTTRGESDGTDGMDGMDVVGPDGSNVDPGSDPAFQRRMLRSERRYEQRMLDQMRDAFAGFEGAAGVVRFHDGGVEADFATRGLKNGVGTADQAGSIVDHLPATTAAALAVSMHKGWLQDYVDGVGGIFGPGFGVDGDQLWRAAEKETGLQLPEDIETLLGDGFAVSVDSSADLKRLAGSDVPVGTPLGIRIAGDPDRIMPIIDKLKRAAGPDAEAVEVSRGDDGVAVSFDAGYAARLLDDGDLGDQEVFRDVVPHADGAAALFYLNFDAGNGWAERLVDGLSGGDPEAKADIAPLRAFGVDAWTDGDQVQHASLRLTTD